MQSVQWSWMVRGRRVHLPRVRRRGLHTDRGWQAHSRFDVTISAHCLNGCAMGKSNYLPLRRRLCFALGKSFLSTAKSLWVMSLKRSNGVCSVGLVGGGRSFMPFSFCASSFPASVVHAIAGGKPLSASPISELYVRRFPTIPTVAKRNRPSAVALRLL